MPNNKHKFLFFFFWVGCFSAQLPLITNGLWYLFSFYLAVIFCCSIKKVKAILRPALCGCLAYAPIVRLLAFWRWKWCGCCIAHLGAKPIAAPAHSLSGSGGWIYFGRKMENYRPFRAVPLPGIIETTGKRQQPPETNLERFARLTGVNPCICPVCKTGQMVTIRELPRIRSPATVFLNRPNTRT